MTDTGLITDAVDRVSSGAAHLVLEKDRQRVGSGSGFLTEHGLVTADHVLSSRAFDTLRIRFSNDDPNGGIRLDPATVNQKVIFRSAENELDLVVVALDEPELKDRHRFSLAADAPTVGTQIVVLGYPYNATALTSHVGYISATSTTGPAEVLHLDASVNPSNSGGPVIDPATLAVLGYVTRAQTGLTDDFDDLVAALESNVAQLSAPVGGSISIAGLDPREAFRVTMASLQRLAVNMKRSANVGIGYAFSAKHITAAIGDTKATS